MSLSFKEKTKNLLTASRYIAVGGIGSLLILFLSRQSLSFNDRAAKKYHRQIQTTLQKVYKLEAEIIKLQSSIGNTSESDFELQVEALEQAVATLKKVPSFLSQQQQNAIATKIDSQASLLTSQYKLLDRYQNSKVRQLEACSQVSSIKQETVENKNVLGSAVANDVELFDAINDLFNLSIAYCQSKEPKLTSPIQNKVSEIFRALGKGKMRESKFFVTRFTNYSDNILTENKIQQDIATQLKIERAISNFQTLETDYLTFYRQQLQKTNNYRLATILLILLVVMANRL